MGHVSEAELSWIHADTATGRTIRSALPSGFKAYGLLDYENSGTTDLNDLPLLNVLDPTPHRKVTAGWLVTSPSMTEPGDEHLLYANWTYRFRRLTGTTLHERAHAGLALPDLFFPHDHSWLVSTLWDDTWRSIGTDAPRARAIAAAIPSFQPIPSNIDISTTGRTLR